MPVAEGEAMLAVEQVALAEAAGLHSVAEAVEAKLSFEEVVVIFRY